MSDLDYITATVTTTTTTTTPTYDNVTDVITTNDTSHDDEITLEHNAVDVISGFVLTLIVILTLFGNSLVIKAVFGFPRLRNTTNMFIISLAVADITVAVLVMPFSIIYTVVLQHWIFGWIFCYFWTSCDVMCCTASILHLCVISLDRYIAIKRPFKYKRIMSKKRAAMLITGIWFCSVFISFVPIYTGLFADSDVMLFKNSYRCGLFVNKAYAVVSSMLSFYLPLIVMTGAYYKIYCIARAQAIDIKKLQISGGTAHDTAHHHRPDDAGIQGKLRRVARNTKAVKTLGTLMGFFIVSWLPFFLMYLILPFCESCDLEARVEAFITWLGYVNSLINPCVYALLNRDFRHAFRRILNCRTGAGGRRFTRKTTTYTQGHSTPCLERFRMTNMRQSTLRADSIESEVHYGAQNNDGSIVPEKQNATSATSQKRKSQVYSRYSELNGNTSKYDAAGDEASTKSMNSSSNS